MGSFFPGIGTNYNIHITISHVIRPLTLTHDHSKIRRAVSRRPTGAKISLDEVGTTIVGQGDQQSVVIADSASSTMTDIFDRDSESRESIERRATYT